MFVIIGQIIPHGSMENSNTFFKSIETYNREQYSMTFSNSWCLLVMLKVLNLQPPHYAQDSSQGIQIPKGFFFFSILSMWNL